MAKNPVLKGKEDAERPFACGVYVGNATADPNTDNAQEVFQQIDLGFSPSFVAVWNSFGQQFTLGNGVPAYVGGAAIQGHPCVYFDGQDPIKILDISPGGFRAYSSWRSNGWGAADANRKGATYYYIAFR